MSATRQTVWMGAIVVVGVLASSSAPAEEHPSYLHHALHELRLARHDLKESKHDFGGHKAAALDATNSAIHHLDKLVAHPHHKLHAASLKPHTNEHHKHHSHIHHALHALREAKVELKASAHDFGGQKAVALTEIDIAINQLEKVVKHHKKA